VAGAGAAAAVAVRVAAAREVVDEEAVVKVEGPPAVVVTGDLARVAVQAVEQAVG